MAWTTPQTWVAGPLTSTALNTHVRDNLKQLATVATIAGPPDLLVNGVFQVNQRGGAPWTADGHMVDRWRLTEGSGSVNSVALGTLTPGVEADHGPNRLEWDLSTLGSADSWIEQRVEDARTASGQSVTVAVTASVASGTKQLKPQIVQDFGTGGSPSSAVTTTGDTITVTSDLTTHYVTIAVPSISGKTLGSNNDHYVSVRLARESGWETGVINVHRVACVRGTASVLPPRVPYVDDLARCQRFYRVLLGSDSAVSTPVAAGVCWSTTIAGFPIPILMRAAPSLASAGTVRVYNGSVDVTSSSVALAQTSRTSVWLNVTVASGLTAGAAALCIASDANSRLALDAEL